MLCCWLVKVGRVSWGHQNNSKHNFCSNSIQNMLRMKLGFNILNMKGKSKGTRRLSRSRCCRSHIWVKKKRYSNSWTSINYGLKRSYNTTTCKDKWGSHHFAMFWLTSKLQACPTPMITARQKVVERTRIPINRKGKSSSILPKIKVRWSKSKEKFPLKCFLFDTPHIARAFPSQAKLTTIVKERKARWMIFMHFEGMGQFLEALVDIYWSIKSFYGQSSGQETMHPCAK